MRRLRWVVVLGLVTLPPVVLVAQPAWAKLPPYTIEVSSVEPGVGQTIGVTVRFWNDVRHTERARWPDIYALDDFLWAVPFEQGEGFSGLAGAFPVDLRQVRPGVFRTEMVLLEPGRWALCPGSTSPCRRAGPARGYPGRIELRAEAAPSLPSAAAPASTSADQGRVPATAVVTSAVVVVATAMIRRARARRP